MNSLGDKISTLARQFARIDLQEMDRYDLQKRTDVKYVFPFARLENILTSLSKNHRLLHLDKEWVQTYNNLYFDTPSFRFYTSHHNTKANRHKVRYREYVGSNTCFFEIKFKNNKDTTVKSRIRQTNIQEELPSEATAFIEKNIPMQATTLKPKLWINFKRIMLVHKIERERITFDVGFRASDKSTVKELTYVVIAEIKLPKFNARSEFIQLMRKNRIRPMSISKYCIGCVLLNKDLKSNSFKEKLRILKKINDEHSESFAVSA